MLIERKSKIKRMLFIAIIGSVLVCMSQSISDPLQLLVAKVISFYPNSIAYNLWQKPPFDIYIKLYIFNVTNSQEFLDGTEKLRFEEIGPYTYKEIMYNINASFNSNGTLTFQPKRLLEFVPDQSVGNPDADVILSPNIPLLGITAALQEYSMFTNLAVASASSYLGSTEFVNVSITDYLFGYNDSLVTFANTVVPNWIDFPKFGILDRLMALDNGSDFVTMNINREDELTDQTAQRFAIDRWNGLRGLNQWGYTAEDEENEEGDDSTCNKVKGTFSGTIFPPNMGPDQTIKLYRHAFCRSIPFKHINNVTTKNGFNGYYYQVLDNFLDKWENNSENTCYCHSDNCFPKGLGTMAPCYYDIPIAMSQPHFLNADPKLLEEVDGLSPDLEKHKFYFVVHPQIGLPLEAKLRLQINLVMPDTQYNIKTKPFNNLVIPLFWIELSVDDIPSIISFYITILYHILPIVQQVLIYLLAIVGACMVIGSSVAVTLLPESKQKPPLLVKYQPILLRRRLSKFLPPEVKVSK